MAYIGCHLSSSKGFLHMGKEALSIGGNTFQFFTRNPRGSRSKKIDPEDAAALCSLMQDNKFGPIVAHAPYTLNACSADAHTREFALETMADDLVRMEYVPGNLYNFHPGSHVGQGPEVGRTFEELRAILDRVELSDKMGVCLDTCHVYDAGYDIVNDLEGVLREFDRRIGIEKLKALHLNDSKNPMGSRKDRHEKIGLGSIGEEAFRRIVRHPWLRGLPMCLETPNELPGYEREIALLRSFSGEP